MDGLDTIDLVGGSPFLSTPSQIEKPTEIDTIDLASEEEPVQAANSASHQHSNATPTSLPPANLTGNSSHQRLCIVLEGTSAVAPHWPRWRAAFIEPFLNRLAGLDYELALVLFRTPDGYSDGVLDSSGWTGDCGEFRRWMDSVDFIGGGSGPCALSDALAEVLYLATVPPTKEMSRPHKSWGSAHSKQGMGGVGNEDSGVESTTGSGVPEGRRASHHCWVLAVSDVHRLPISWPLKVGSIDPGRGNIQTLLAGMRSFGLSFSVLSVTRGNPSSNLYKRLFKGFQEAASGGGNKARAMESGEMENHDWFDLYSLLVDPKWRDGLEFFSAEKRRVSESVPTRPTKSTNNAPMISQVASSSAVQQNESTVMSGSTSSAPNQYHTRSPHQMPNPTHGPGAMRIPKQQMLSQPAMVSNAHLKNPSQMTSPNTVAAEGFVPSQPRIIPMGGLNPGAMHGAGPHSTLPHMTPPPPHRPPVNHVPNNISPVSPMHQWGPGPQQTYAGGPIQPQVPQPHHPTGIQHHQTGQSLGYMPGSHQRNSHGMIGGHVGVTGTEKDPNIALGHQVGVQPSMQPPQMVGQSAQGMAGMQKPVASTMMHSPMTAPQHFHQSKRQRYTRNVQPPTHMLNPGGHNTQLTQAPGPTPKPTQPPMYTAWEGPMFIIPQLARTQGVPNVKLFDVQVLSNQQIFLQQMWPAELTIYHFEEMKNFGHPKFYITQKPGTSTEIGDKLVGNLAEKSLAGQIDVGDEHHILVVKVKIKNGQAVLLGTLMPRTQIGPTVV